jgi:tRNA A-37 threonylcarbamoyl transferase component Bud32
MADDQPTVIQTVALPVPVTVADRLALALGSQHEVRACVGSGGFAEVYEVMDLQLERRLAIKVLRPDQAWGESTLARFRAEARAIAALDHPNILPIHFVGEGQGLVYYAMPFIEGESLTSALKQRGPMPVERVLPLAQGVLAALEHAHEAGLVHRDIKPDNIMLDARTGRPLLVDFGIAKRLDGSAGTTQAGFVVGTPAYMSPEQALGTADLDARSDLYSFAAVMYQLLTGAPPYEGADSQEVVGKHLNAPVPEPTTKNARVPAWLSAVIVRGLAKHRSSRFQTATEMADALRAGTPATPALIGGSGPSRIALYVVASALMLVLALGVLANRRRHIMVVNRMPVPIAVVVGTDSARHIAPNDSSVVEVRPTATLPVSWYVTGANAGSREAPDLQHTAVLDARPRTRELRLEARADALDPAVFLPYITNATGFPLTLRVNVGTAVEVSCQCRVLTGAVRVPVGAYQLFRNSSVRAVLPDGRVATFEGLGSQVNRESGVVRLRFDLKDFRDTTGTLRARLH